MKEDQLQLCKALFKKNYRLMYSRITMHHRRETYKYYSAIGRTEGLFAINKLTLSDLVAHKIFLLDGDKLTDMELAFMTIKGRQKVGKFQPKTALIRFEFLEMLFRIALKRFFDSTDYRTPAE
ncbi:MAG: hypothetical protein P4M11_02885 [Candidatus Pacebacteria bacterium]|nr:hypothetical protein [Candidatus Paceibacterota bacterium]